MSEAIRSAVDERSPYGDGTLPPGIRSRSIANVNGLTIHLLEAGFAARIRRTISCSG